MPVFFFLKIMFKQTEDKMNHCVLMNISIPLSMGQLRLSHACSSKSLYTQAQHCFELTANDSLPTCTQ